MTFEILRSHNLWKCNDNCCLVGNHECCCEDVVGHEFKLCRLQVGNFVFQLGNLHCLKTADTANIQTVTRLVSLKIC
jgi:hypothetical protein